MEGFDLLVESQFKSERVEAIAGMGGRNAVDHVAYDGSKTVAISADVDDAAGMMAALASPGRSRLTHGEARGPTAPDHLCR